MFTPRQAQFIQKLVMHRLATAHRVTGQPNSQPRDTTAGLTLIECLVAIVMVGLVVGMITPALVISVATRVNSQKTEQALEVAQSEIDEVRTIVERGVYEADELPPSTPFTEADGNWSTETTADGREYRIEYPQTILGPDADLDLLAEDTTYADMDPFEARQVDVDGDNNPDFAVQVYRSPGQVDEDGIPIAFSMGVRVYDILAFDGDNTGNLVTDQASASLTAGESDRGDLPLAVLYTSITKGDVSSAYCDYIEYLGSTPSATYQCD